MARIEDLIADVPDAHLRSRIEQELRVLKERTRFGLVFERHLPESVALPASVGLNVGDQVELRTASPGQQERLTVASLDGETCTVVSEGGETTEAQVVDVLVVKDFGTPIFPALTSLGRIERSESRDPHLVINGENYHALQVLGFTHAGKADCIYIDPPYNTGASDWKYNNDYVDSNDRFRHSKWLSFMEKRLLLAKRLLKTDGVLIVTIDEHEVSHLGVLLEQLFPEYERQLVSIVINPKGVTRPQGGLSRVDEYAFVCFPAGTVIEGRGDDYLTPSLSKAEEDAFSTGTAPRWQGLLHSGEGHRRQDRQTMFYPVLIDPERGAVIGAGKPLLPIENKDGVLEWPEPDLDAKVEGHTAVWPVRKDGSWGRWYIGADTLRDFVSKGYVALGGYDEERKTWAMRYLFRSLREQIADGRIEVVRHDPVRNAVELRYSSVPTRRLKTVWHRSRHDAGAYGSDLLSNLLGERRFDFPKSLYAVRDTLAAAVANKPDALVLDFFAGSGTTLHATCLLNAADGGSRRCVLVTNNEVSGERAKQLEGEGLFLGDDEFERHGIFQAVTRPRVEAAITGGRPDTQPIEGAYLDGRAIRDGFEENAEFFRLDYLNPESVELGLEYEALHPLLWLLAGAKGTRPQELRSDQPFTVAESSGYAVLFDERALSEFIKAISDKPDVVNVFLVTDYQDAFAEMSIALGPGRSTHMLPRDYLRRFSLNAGVSA